MKYEWVSQNEGRFFHGRSLPIFNKSTVEDIIFKRNKRKHIGNIYSYKKQTNMITVIWIVSYLLS